MDLSFSQPVTRPVDITRLRNFAAEKLPHESPLRDILLQEKDQIPAAEFLAKLQVWLALLRRREEPAQ